MESCVFKARRGCGRELSGLLSPLASVRCVVYDIRIGCECKGWKLIEKNIGGAERESEFFVVFPADSTGNF